MKNSETEIREKSEKLFEEDIPYDVREQVDLPGNIMEISDNPLAYLDPDFNIIKVNSAYCRSSGLLLQEVTGHNYFKLFPDAATRKIFQKVKDSGKPLEFCARASTSPDRSEEGAAFRKWKLTPVRNANDQVVGLLLSNEPTAAQDNILKESRTSAYRFITVTTVLIFITEAIFAILLHLLPRPSSLLFTILDALFMAILLIPLLYIFLLRPLILNISERKRAQEELKKINEKLELKVRERTSELLKINERLKAEIWEHNQAEKELQKKTHELMMRVKALNCFYDVSRLMVQQDLDFPRVIQQIVEFIPPTFEYPEFTSARITLNGRDYLSSNFQETRWDQSEKIEVKGEKRGELRVFYTEEITGTGGDFFRKEERVFLAGLSRLIGKYTQRIETEEALKTALESSQQRKIELEALLTGARVVLERREFEVTAGRIFDSCKKLIGATAGYVALLSEDGKENEVVFLDSGGKESLLDPNLPIPIRGLRETVYNSGKTVYENSFSRREWTKFLPAGHLPLENVLFSPVLMENRVVGLLGLGNKPGGFTDDDKRMATAFGELVSIALINSLALQSLENSEERFRSVAQTASDAIVNIDQQGRVIFWNTAAERIFGYTADEIAGRDAVILMPERFRKKHQKGLQHLFSTGKSRRIGEVTEMTGLRKNGEEFPVGLSLAFWKMGEQMYFTGIIRDISEQKQLEGELRKSRDELELRVQERTLELSRINTALRDEIQERMRIEAALDTERQRIFSVLDKLPASVHLQSSDYNIQFANRFFRERFGDPEGKTCYNLLHNCPSPCADCDINRIFKTRKPYELEEVHADGKLYHVYNYPFTDTDGSTLILQLGIDITRQKEAEKALRASEERFRLLVNSMSDIVVTLNNNMEVEAIYGNVGGNIGISAEQFIGKSLNEIFSPKDRTIHSRAIRRAMKGEMIVYEWVMKNPEEDRYMQSSLAPIYNPDGEIEGVVGVARDITVQKIMEHQLIQTEKLLTVAEMSAMIAHEFRNSLTSVRMILELQLESPGLTISEVKSLSVALSSIQHMENIVTQLLNFSSPADMVFGPGDLKEVIEDSLEFVNLQMRKNQVNVIKKLVPHITSLEMDAKSLKEAFVNLLLNAIQAIALKGAQPNNRKITVSAGYYILPETLLDHISVTSRNNHEEKGDDLVLSEGTACIRVQFRDTGIGIGKKKIPRIFDPFFTTMPGGTGLGLSMVKKTVNAHGGIIRVKSRRGRGTTFSIYIPLKGRE